MTDLPQSHDDSLSQELARQEAPPTGSLLRVRDVQALNRSFRRLAEVQEALLDQMEQLREERRSPSRWVLPLLAVGCLVLGFGATVFGLSWWESRQETPTIEVQAPPTEVSVTPSEVPIQVQIPEEAFVNRETLDNILAELRAAQETSRRDRATIADLNRRLIDQEETMIETLRGLGTLAAEIPIQSPATNQAGGNQPRPASIQGAPSNGTGAPTNGQADPATGSQAAADNEAVDPEQVFLGVLNGLLHVEGYTHLRFEQGTRVPGKAQLRNVQVFEWDGDGILDSLLKAERAEFQLHQMTGSLVILFYGGHRTRNGERRPLLEEGSRMDLPGVRPESWLDLWPELAGSVVDEPREPSAQTELVRERLDDLISLRRAYGYLRLSSLGGIEGQDLKWVQLNWFDSSGLLLKTLEADSLQIRLHEPDTVELVLRNGGIVEGGLRRPFFDDKFRFLLPQQILQDWRQSGVPFTDVET